MLNETSRNWLHTGTILVQVTGKSFKALAALCVLLFGLVLGCEAVVGLVLPEGELVKLYLTVLASNALAASMSSSVSFGGRPPVRPSRRAAARPAWVRSRIRLRSNSASAPNM